MKMKPCNAGYTLLEIMIVLAITAMLVSMAVTNYSDQIPHQQLRNASAAIVGELQLARQKAIAKGAPEEILFSPNVRQYGNASFGMKTLPSHVRFDASNVTKNTYGERNLPASGIRFNNNRDSAAFQADGTGNEGSIYLTNSKKESIAITVNITGHVRKYLWNGNAWK